jgi:extracellular factor (EF) 3-hydroxypalmitic acid methyl ester biosynthesis protein
MTELEYLHPGKLYLKDGGIEIIAAYGSKNSLFVNFKEKVWFKNGQEFERTEIVVNNETIALGKCVYKNEQDVPNFAGRIIFISDVYDFGNIFSINRMANLDAFFQNLPLVLAQKKKAKDSFLKYTSDLTYDLRVYQKFFEELDDIYKKEPPDVYSAAQKTIIETQGRKFFHYFDGQLDELEKITREFTKEEQEDHAYFFRWQVWDFIKESKFLTRTNTKPRGYPGDSEMMSMVYRDMYEGDTIFQKLMHKHPIETKSAQAVRNRKTMLTKLISSLRTNNPELENEIQMLSVASGPARELENIIISPEHCSEFHITLLDQDTDALNEASLCIRRIENRFDHKIDYRLINESVRTMLRIKNLNQVWGEFDFIYSMGLFDYLSTRVAEAVVEKLYTLLKPGGRMVIGNYHEKNPTKTYMDYWGDWVLYYRSEEDFKKIAEPLEGCQKDIIFEDSGCQMFLIVNKYKT